MNEPATNRRIEVGTDVIIHATESAEKILSSLETALGLAGDEFAMTRTDGHFGNPITIYRSTTTGRRARLFLKKFCGLLSEEQLDSLLGQIEERVVDSRLHIRIDKQALIMDGRLVIIDEAGGDTVKIKIHTPVYNKRDTVPAFREVLSGSA